MMRFTHLVIFCAATIGALSLTRAEASVRMCNETSYVLHVAAAYQRGVVSKSEGWVTLLQGQCKTALNNVLNSASAFVYAKSDPAHAGQGLLFSGSERFCVDEYNKPFAIEGRSECRRRGFFAADFTPVVRRGNSSTVDFTEKNALGPQRAILAGVQRMLTDLRYEIGTIDGFGGQRTREAIAAFKLRSRISGNPGNRQLLRQLIKVVRKEAGQRGLIVCNKTKYQVWAATGIVKDDSFESAGWLYIAPENCMQGINSQLNDRYYFYYAEAVADNGLPLIEAGRRKVWSGDFVMCTKQTRFVISGTENCLGRGFEAVKFRKVDTGTAIKWQVDLE